jgi:hypothetical protein
MLVLYVAPPAALLGGTLARRADIALPGALAWGLMTAAYLPTVRRYAQPWWLALSLPLAGMLYTAMTVDSARRHARRAGGTWKGRHFTPDRSP